MKKTLLDLDRIPTIDEMIAFFKENDWSTTNIYDESERTPEMNEEISHVKRLIKNKFDPLAKKMGRKKHPSCYSKDHPLMKLQDGSTEVIACLVEKLINEQPDVVEKIFDHFNLFTDPDVHEKADKLYEKAIETLMQVMQYEDIAKITEETQAHTDFSNIKDNNPKRDYIRKWNHITKKTTTVSLDQLDDNELDTIADETEQDKELLTEAASVFWDSLDTEEKLIMNYRINGWDYVDIAEAMGYKTHSAIVKKRQNIEVKFKVFLEKEYNFS